MNLTNVKDKKTIFIDFDCTAFNTIEAIVSLYDDDFSSYDNYKKIDWCEVETWGFEELNCASRDYIDTYFNQKRFFRTVQPMDYFEEVLDVLKEKYKIVFCSAGYTPNLKLKEEFLNERYSFAEFIGVNLEKYSDKSHVDMNGAIFIDDSKKNLETSNASIKILFGDDYEWNKGWTGLRCYNWMDVLKSLQKLSNF